MRRSSSELRSTQRSVRSSSSRSSPPVSSRRRPLPRRWRPRSLLTSSPSDRRGRPLRTSMRSIWSGAWRTMARHSALRRRARVCMRARLRRRACTRCTHGWRAATASLLSSRAGGPLGRRGSLARATPTGATWSSWATLSRSCYRRRSSSTCCSMHSDAHTGAARRCVLGVAEMGASRVDMRYSRLALSWCVWGGFCAVCVPRKGWGLGSTHCWTWLVAREDNTRDPLRAPHTDSQLRGPVSLLVRFFCRCTHKFTCAKCVHCFRAVRVRACSDPCFWGG
mmetsp:Transcript_22619/g.52105  ORF Transcript_22619/g.52105 Transcript_22619/m.52105 type:complete len:280 (+) Transcript_22619:312-1151(+)